MTKNKGPSITMEGYLTCLLAYIHTQTYIHICLQSTCLDACLGAYETTSQSTYLPNYLPTDVEKRRQERALLPTFFQPPHPRLCRLRCIRRYDLHGSRSFALR